MTGNVKKKRNGNLDLLRIIIMLMVVVHHAFNHGNIIVNTSLSSGAINWCLSRVIYDCVTVAVNCFVVISAYFLCTSSFKLKKWVSIWGQTLFYSVVIFFTVTIGTNAFGGAAFSLKELVRSVLVFTSGRYWFVTAYLLMYAIFPFLNAAVRGMDKRKHLLCCCTLFILFSVLDDFAFFNDFSYIKSGYSFLFFCILYIFASYIRLYVPERVKHQKYMLLGYAICIFIAFFTRVVVNIVSPYLIGNVLDVGVFNSYNSCMMLLASLFLFQFFRGINIKRNKVNNFIGAVAPLTFAVYLIHENPMLRPILWKWFNFPAYVKSPLLIPYVLFVAIAIFTMCCFIEYIRQHLFKLLHITDSVNRVCDKIQAKVIKAFDKI